MKDFWEIPQSWKLIWRLEFGEISSWSHIANVFLCFYYWKWWKFVMKFVTLYRSVRSINLLSQHTSVKSGKCKLEWSLSNSAHKIMTSLLTLIRLAIWSWSMLYGRKLLWILSTHSGTYFLGGMIVWNFYSALTHHIQMKIAQVQRLVWQQNLQLILLGVTPLRKVLEILTNLATKDAGIQALNGCEREGPN